MNQPFSRAHLSSHPQGGRQVYQTSRNLPHTIRVKVKVALLGAAALLVAAIISSCSGTGGPSSTPTPTLVLSPSPSPVVTPTVSPGDIFVGNLAPGYGLGVNTSGGRVDWLIVKNGEICMAYPSGQSWGAVFVTVGNPTLPPRPGKDFSNFTHLSLELLGQAGGESAFIGIKDNSQPDDGSETRVPVSSLTTNWKPVVFPLSQFSGANLHKLYVVIEFVFAGSTPETMCARNIQYLP